MILNIDDIQKLIPHRYPFLLIDRVEEVVLGESAVGIKAVSMNEWYFQGHFPQKPVLPGVLIIEALAQTAAALVVKTMQEKEESYKASHEHIVYFMSIGEAKFRKPIIPGDTIKLKVQKGRSRGNIWRFTGQAFVDNQLAAEATFMAMISDK